MDCIENEEKLLAEQEASQFLNIAIDTLRSWRKKKINLPFIKVGTKLVRYKRSDLQEYLNKNTVRVGFSNER